MATVQTLTEPPELEPLLAADRPVWLFKHSLSCGVSARACRRFEAFAAGRPESAGRFYKVEVQRSRELSRAIAERTGVGHQSPQALLLSGGEVVWHDSHWRISEEALAEAEARAGSVAANAAAEAAPAEAGR